MKTQTIKLLKGATEYSVLFLDEQPTMLSDDATGLVLWTNAHPVTVEVAELLEDAKTVKQSLEKAVITKKVLYMRNRPNHPGPYIPEYKGDDGVWKPVLGYLTTFCEDMRRAGYALIDVPA